MFAQASLWETQFLPGAKVFRVNLLPNSKFKHKQPDLEAKM